MIKYRFYLIVIFVLMIGVLAGCQKVSQTDQKTTAAGQEETSTSADLPFEPDSALQPTEAPQISPPTYPPPKE